MKNKNITEDSAFYVNKNSLQEYLNDISKYPVLTADEEINLFKRLIDNKKCKLLKKQTINNYEINTLDIDLLLSSLLKCNNVNFILNIFISYYNVSNNDNNILEILRKFKKLYNNNLLIDEKDLNKYFNIIYSNKLLSEKELLNNSKQFINYKKTYDKIANCNLRLVVSIVKKIKGKLDLLDLINEGNLSLLHAIDKFDYTLGYKFSTYASRWIKDGARRAIINQYYSIRVPEQFYNDAIKIKNLIEQIPVNERKHLTLLELSKKLNIHINNLDKYLIYLQNTVSLDSSIDDENENNIIDSIKSNTNVEEEVFNNSLKEEINKLCKILTEREIKIINLRYGLLDNCPLSLSQTSKRINLSRERIRQLEYNALFKMKTYLEENKLSDSLKEYLKK